MILPFLRWLRARPFLPIFYGCVSFVGAAARAETPAPAPAPAKGAAEQPAAALKPFLERDYLLGDWGGLRTRLADKGIAFNLLYTAEEFGNPVGGARRGQVYDGLGTAGLDVDFGKLVGDTLKGLQFHALAYYPHGASGTNRYVRDLGRFSNIDFYDSLRLFELWFDYTAFDGRFSLRLGQLAADAEFATTDAGALFINASFGALPTFSFNVPVPIYAIAAPGVRLRLSTKDQRWYFQGAAYDGNPDPDTLGDPTPGSKRGTTYNHSGTHINLNSREGAFLVGQLGFRLNRAPGDKGLPGTYRVGAFYHTDTFSDNRLDRAGLALADPRSGGLARAHRGDYGAYFAADQNVYVAPGAAPFAGAAGAAASAPVGNVEDTAGSGGSPPAAPEASGLAISVYLRAGVAPDDRNFSPFSLDTGFNLRGLLPGRPKDVFGLGFSRLAISDSRRAAARDRNRFVTDPGAREPLPDYEAVWEITYQANLTPWFQLQPDLQYIIHPGGTSRHDDALVLGLRSVVTF